MATLHTYNGMVYIGVPAAIITEAAEFKLDVEGDEAVDSAFGDEWETALKGIKRWSGSMAGNFDTASTAMFDAAVSNAAQLAYFYPDRASTARYYYGSIFPKLSIDVKRTDVGRISGGFRGTGPLTYK